MRPNESIGRVAAFFDLDGTLIPRPSLEKRFFAELRWRRAIPIGNYFLWMARAAQLAPQGIQMMRYANKMYLRGVHEGRESSTETGQPSWQDAGQVGFAVPRFFPAAMNQVAWHAKEGHGIVLVSGTLAPLAEKMALALAVRLAVRGIEASVGVCATRLEEKDGRWTGRIIGDAMFGKAKARAVRRIAGEGGFDLSQCYAYGNCVNDRWMLEAVGRPAVVNASRGIARVARRRGWMALTWTGKSVLTQRAQTMHRRSEAEKVA
jgi:HAD superfamily hydrolase (TIGR01490 family)